MPIVAVMHPDGKTARAIRVQETGYQPTVDEELILALDGERILLKARVAELESINLQLEESVAIDRAMRELNRP